MAQESVKRSVPDENELLEGVKVILLDIEGTTTPISFVKDKLFPYVEENLKTYLESHWETDECKADVDALRELAKKDKEAGVEGLVDIVDGDDKAAVLASVVDNVLWQMKADKKTAALKQLQGHMWRDAYKAGKVQGELYPDVLPAIREWISEKRKVYIFSSGSVESQKLLFSHSTAGDVTEMISGYFDTSVGSKGEKESYTKIAETIEVAPSQVLFLTDVPQEASAATKAGVNSCLVARDGNQPLTDDDLQTYNLVESFTELTSAENGDAKRLEACSEDDDEFGDEDDAEVEEDDEEEDDIPGESNEESQDA
jgi:enolase-phosphatase E1